MSRIILIPFLMAVMSMVRAQTPPNILILFADDQRADAFGAAGNPYISTPIIDRLSALGTRFTQAYCMGGHHGAICAPSRAMLMSGRQLFKVYDRLNGVLTMPMWFGEHGYRTFVTGKWHSEKEALAAGFQEAKSVFFGGMDDHFRTAITDKLPDGSFSPTREEGFSTRVFADALRGFLQSYADSDRSRPFFAYAAFTAPHDPRSPDSAYLGRYPQNGLPIPPNFLPVHPFNIHDMQVRDENLGAYPRTPEMIRGQLADYYALITQLDDEIGRIFRQLERDGLMENTIIVYAADNGLSLGSHGLLGKQDLYEHSMRVPLIMKGPGVLANASRDAMVYLLDIFPTLCDLAGLPKPDSLYGTSLLPVLTGAQKEVRNSLFTAYRSNVRAVRDGRWKFIRYPHLHFSQLYDLQSDPWELNNLAGKPEFSTDENRMLQLMQQWQKELEDPHPFTQPVKESGAFDPSTFPRQPDPHQPPYVLERYFKDG